MPTLAQAFVPVWLWLLVACLPSILGSVVPAMAAAKPPAVLERAIQLATELETAEAQLPSMEQEDVMQATLLYTVQDLRLYLERHPKDVRALVVMAPLIRLQQAFEHVYGEAGLPEVEPGTVQQQFHSQIERLTYAHTLLGRALSLAPRSAEAHYWKSRLYSMTQPIQRDGQVSFTSSP